MSSGDDDYGNPRRKREYEANKAARVERIEVTGDEAFWCCCEIKAGEPSSSFPLVTTDGPRYITIPVRIADALRERRRNQIASLTDLPTKES